MKTDYNNGATKTVWVLPVCILVVAAIVYFKIKSDEASLVHQQLKENHLTENIAVPDTTVATDALVLPDESISIAVPDSVGIDTRPAMEAGDEDGYWDGWYDGAETMERQRYDESCNFSSPSDRQVYAQSYREGYEKGFEEAVSRRKQQAPTDSMG